MSFCAEVKAEALGVQIKKSCCRRAFIVGTLFLGSVVQDDAIVLPRGQRGAGGSFCKAYIRAVRPHLRRAKRQAVRDSAFVF